MWWIFFKTYWGYFSEFRIVYKIGPEKFSRFQEQLLMCQLFIITLSWPLCHLLLILCSNLDYTIVLWPSQRELFSYFSFFCKIPFAINENMNCCALLVDYFQNSSFRKGKGDSLEFSWQNKCFVKKLLLFWLS